MTSFEEMESIIEEWYSDCSINGPDENNMKQYFELKEKNKK